jgi:hypothetical protein
VLGSVDPVSHGVAVAPQPVEDIARHMKGEIQRIITQLSEPYVP